MQIFCSCYLCRWNRFLDVPIRFQHRKHYYVPFENDVCRGECTKGDIEIGYYDLKTQARIYKNAPCMSREEIEV